MSWNNKFKNFFSAISSHIAENNIDGIIELGRNLLPGYTITNDSNHIQIKPSDQNGDRHIGYLWKFSNIDKNNPISKSSIIRHFNEDHSVENKTKQVAIGVFNALVTDMINKTNTNFFNRDKVYGTNELTTNFRSIGEGESIARNALWISQYLNNNFQFVPNNTRELTQTSSRGSTIESKLESRFNTLLENVPDSLKETVKNTFLSDMKNNAKIHIVKNSLINSDNIKNIRLHPNGLLTKDIEYNTTYNELFENYYKNLLNDGFNPTNPHINIMALNDNYVLNSFTGYAPLRQREIAAEMLSERLPSETDNIYRIAGINVNPDTNDLNELSLSMDILLGMNAHHTNSETGGIFNLSDMFRMIPQYYSVIGDNELSLTTHTYNDEEAVMTQHVIKNGLIESYMAKSNGANFNTTPSTISDSLSSLHNIINDLLGDDNNLREFNDIVNILNAANRYESPNNLIDNRNLENIINAVNDNEISVLSTENALYTDAFRNTIRDSDIGDVIEDNEPINTPEELNIDNEPIREEPINEPIREEPINEPIREEPINEPIREEPPLNNEPIRNNEPINIPEEPINNENIIDDSILVTNEILGINERDFEKIMDNFEQRKPAGGGHWEFDDDGNRLFKGKLFITKDTINKLKNVRELVKSSGIGLVDEDYFVSTISNNGDAVKKIEISKSELEKFKRKYDSIYNKYQEHVNSMLQNKVYGNISRQNGRRLLNISERANDEVADENRKGFIISNDTNKISDLRFSNFIDNHLRGFDKNRMKEIITALTFGAIHKKDGDKLHIYYDNIDNHLESLSENIDINKIKFGFRQPLYINGFKVVQVDNMNNSSTSFKNIIFGSNFDYLYLKNKRMQKLNDFDTIMNLFNENNDHKIFNLDGEPKAKDFLGKGFLLPSERLDRENLSNKEKGFLFIPKSTDIGVTFGNEIEGDFSRNIRNRYNTRSSSTMIDIINDYLNKDFGLNANSLSVLKGGGILVEEEYSTRHKYEFTPGVFQGFRGLKLLYNFYDILQTKLEHKPTAKGGGQYDKRADVMGIHINIGTIPEENRRDIIRAAADYNRLTEEVRKRMIVSDARYTSWNKTSYNINNSFMDGVYEGLEFANEFRDPDNEEFYLRNVWSQSLDKFRVVKIPTKRELERYIERGGEGIHEYGREELYRNLGLKHLKKFLDFADEYSGVEGERRNRALDDMINRWSNELRDMGADDNTVNQARQLMERLRTNTTESLYGKTMSLYDFLRKVGMPGIFPYKGSGDLGRWSYYNKVQTVSYSKIANFGIFEVRTPDFAEKPETNFNLNVVSIKHFTDVYNMAMQYDLEDPNRLYISNRVIPPEEGWSDNDKNTFDKIAKSILFMDDPGERELMWQIHKNCKNSKPNFQSTERAFTKQRVKKMFDKFKNFITKSVNRLRRT